MRKQLKILAYGRGISESNHRSYRRRSRTIAEQEHITNWSRFDEMHGIKHTEATD